MSRRLPFFFILLSLAIVVRAREIPRRARIAYEAALRREARGQWPLAERDILLALREGGAYTEAYSTYASWLLLRHRYAAAAAMLKEGEKRCPDGPKIFARPLAQSLLCSGDIAGALARVPPATKDSFWTKLSAQATMMQLLLRDADTGVVTPIGPQWGINTSSAELFPILSSNGQRLYFTRRMSGADEDFFYTVPDTCGGWQSARNMGSPPNTLQQEAAQFISTDGHYLFFMRCDNRTISGWDQGGCDLLMAYRANLDSPWSNALPFGGTINTPGYEGMPSLSSDNRELYFVSAREGGYGGLDIWSSRFEHGLWQAPHNLGPGVNTAGDETAPFIYADNATLYFTSNGRPGMGGSDIFISRKEDTAWTPAVNLGPPVNTPFDEASLSLNRSGDTAFFASDRDSLAGNFDLYQYPLPARFRPQPVFYMQGKVYDSVERGPLNYANIYITDSATGREVYQVQSNRGDGSYSIALPVGRRYWFFTDRVAYGNREDTLWEAPGAGEAMTKDFALLPADYVAPVKDSLVCTLFFPKNGTELSDSTKTMLRTRMQAWRGLPGTQVLVNGYTDNTGTPIINEQISYKRAAVVAAAVTAEGFDVGAVQSQGWGEAAPLVENDTEEHRDRNRRVEIIIRR